MQFVMVVQKDVIFMLTIEKKNIKMTKFLDLDQELIKTSMVGLCVMKEDCHTIKNENRFEDIIVEKSKTDITTTIASIFKELTTSKKTFLLSCKSFL